MKIKIMRALAVALIAVALLLTGVAPIGLPGVEGVVVSLGQ